MPWDERQRAMLAELGIRWWAPAGDADASADPPARDAPAGTAARGGTAATAAAHGPAGEPGSAAVAWPGPDAAASGSIATTLDWPALRTAIAGCTACALCASRRAPVFGAGADAEAHWLFVGEPPGEPEDAQAEPVAGRAALLFANMLRAVGLAPEAAEPAQRAFVANIVRCRPPNGRAPSADELAACAPFIARQIALVRPRVVVAMGALAVQGLLGSREPLGKLRGRAHRVHGVPLVVTYAPAYLLRQPLDKARAWDDLRLAAGIAAGPAPA